MRSVHKTTLYSISIFLCACTAKNPSATEEGLHPAPAEATFQTTIVRPASSGKLRLKGQTMDGSLVGVSCITCHGEASEKKTTMMDGAKVESFHGHIALAHGDLSCDSCHASDTPQKLKLSEGKLLRLDQSMNLCGRCHSGQKKSFDHGAHGGMRGHWDLSKGPGERNDCITCHSPHAPALPKVKPMPGPKDRFIHRPSHGDHGKKSLIEQRLLKEGGHHE